MSSVIIIVLFNYDVNILKVKMIRLICYYFFFGLYVIYVLFCFFLKFGFFRFVYDEVFILYINNIIKVFFYNIFIF